MNVKRYFAKDMQEAMEKIRKELGSDAVILSSKPVRPKGAFKLFSKKIMEVMVAYESPGVPKVTPRFQQDAAYTRSEAVNAAFKTAELKELFEASAEPGAAHKSELVKNEMFRVEAKPPVMEPFVPKAEPAQNTVITEQLSELHAMMSRMGERFDKLERKDDIGRSDEARDMLEQLVKCEVASELAEEIVEAAAQAGQGEDFYAALREEIIRRLGSSVPIAPSANGRTVVLLLGATGVGKTTSLVKLAALFTLRDKLKVGMINTDTYRVSAQEQLKTYAEILGTPVSTVYSPAEITQALKEQEDRDIIFIDTAGKRPTDEKHKEEIMQLVELSEADEILLVISASTSLSAIETIIRNYSFLENYKLLLTKIDEVAYCSAILNACHISGMPLSYLATGQNVPDDIEEANITELAGKLVGSTL